MKINEAVQQVVAIYPGRFHPFHKGHASVYNYLRKKFDTVFIATSDKVDPPRSPFSFAEKREMMIAAGIPPSAIVQTKNPYQAQEILQAYDPATTAVVFAVSEKDMAEDPRFSFANKKDGSPSYFQPMAPNAKQMQSFDKHGYITTVPTLDFTILGEPMRSATELRRNFANADPETQKTMVNDLYGAYNDRVYQILSSKLAESLMLEDYAKLTSVINRIWELDLERPLSEEVKSTVLANIKLATEAWSEKYKRSINCNNPKGFSQRAHCQGRKKNEDINEAFDSPYPMEWQVEAPNEYSAWAKIPFKGGDFSWLNVDFDQPTQGNFAIEFTLGGRTKASGKGDEFRIFATVIEAIKQWWKKIDQRFVDSIYFSASKDPNDSERRHVLYSRFAKQFASQIGYTLDVTDKGRSVSFLLTAPKRTYQVEVSENQYSDLELAIMEGGHSLEEGVGRDVANWAKRQYRKVVPFTQADTKNMIDNIAKEKGIDPRVMQAMADKESSYNTGAIGDKGKSHGLFQLQNIAVKDINDWYKTDYTDSDRMDPETNARMAAMYLQLAKDKYGAKNDVEAIAMFNGGPKALTNRNAINYARDVVSRMKRDQQRVVREAGVGKITKQNATKDAPIGSEFANVKKLGLGSGKPPELHKKARKNSDPNTLFNIGLAEGKEGSYLLQLERDDDLLVLHITHSRTGKRTEVRGKPDYEGDGYDPNDPLHQLLDKIGKAASISDLMNGELVSINPVHPQGPSAKAHAEKAFVSEDFAQDLEAEFPGLDLDLYTTRSGYILSKIVLPVGQRNEGTGSKVMQRIVDMADQEGKLIALTPDTAFGGTKSRLIKFYKRFGFVPNKGRNKTFDFREIMVRYPQSKQLSESSEKDVIIHFVQFCKDKLKLPSVPKIIIKNKIDDTTFGQYNTLKKDISIRTGDRHIMDVLRTLAHELVHHGQRLITPDLDGSDGSAHENQANAIAGVLLRKYGEDNPKLYEHLEERASIGVPLSSGLTVTIAPHRALKIKKSTPGRHSYGNPKPKRKNSK